MSVDCYVHIITGYQFPTSQVTTEIEEKSCNCLSRGNGKFCKSCGRKKIQTITKKTNKALEYISGYPDEPLYPFDGDDHV